MTDPGLDEFDNVSVCREYTLPRPNDVNTGIGPVRDMNRVEIKIQSIQYDGSVCNQQSF